MIDLGDTRLFVEVAGEGRPVVLLHGFSLDLRSWDDQVPALATVARVVRYDLRGFGRSDRPGTLDYSHAEDLVALLDRLGIGRAILVGLSLGANVALEAALTHPDRVEGLVLVSSGLPGHAWTTARPPDEAAAHGKAHGTTAAKRFWLGHALFAPARRDPAVAARLAGIVEDYSGWHWENRNPARPAPAVAARLGEVAAPTLVVSGADDLPGYREIAGILAAGIPGARSVVIEGAGHMAPMERPEAFNRALLAFLATV